MVSSLVRGEKLKQQVESSGDRDTLVRGSSSPFFQAFWEHAHVGTQSCVQSGQPQIEAPFIKHESITWKNYIA